MKEQLNFDIVDNYFDTCCSSESVCKAWQTLKSTVLAHKQSIKLPKEAVENIVECISNQRDIPVEFKAVLANNFWDLL